MYLANESSEQVRQLLADLTQANEKLVQRCTAVFERVVLEAQGKTTLGDEFAGSLLVIAEGTASLSIGEDVILSLTEGDLFGLPADRLLTDIAIRTDFAVHVSVYPIAAIEQQALEDELFRREWYAVQHIRSALFMHLFAESSLDESQAFPSIRTFEKGDVIVEEGTEATEVFTLVEGMARVLHNGVEVGVIEEDEIFGALASLTGTLRTASVIANQACLVAALPVDNFRSLIKSRPQTTEKLIHDFAKKIMHLNSRIAGE